MTSVEGKASSIDPIPSELEMRNRQHHRMHASKRRYWTPNIPYYK